MTPATTHNPMPQAERGLLASMVGDAEPRLTLRTRTRIDTGRWWVRSPLWLCVTDDRVILIASSKRSYCESIGLADCANSHYSHTTGQLVIEPAERLRFARMTLSPKDAMRVLHRIGQGDQTNNTKTHPPTETENQRA